jgi:peroxiredoxin
MAKIQLHQTAPDFELTDFNGQPVRLANFRGQHVVLVFNRGFM